MLGDDFEFNNSGGIATRDHADSKPEFKQHANSVSFFRVERIVLCYKNSSISKGYI